MEHIIIHFFNLFYVMNTVLLYMIDLSQRSQSHETRN